MKGFAMQRPTRKVRVKETKEVIVVNHTPKKLLAELMKPEDEQDINFIRSQNEHEPYYDPNIHEPLDANDDDEDAKPKPKPRTPLKPATPAAAKKTADDDDDE
jgi:hypothetical protein